MQMFDLPSFGILSTVLVAAPQEGYRTAGKGAKEGNQNDQKVEAPSLQGKAFLFSKQKAPIKGA